MDFVLIFGIIFCIITPILFAVLIELDRREFETELKDECRERYGLSEEELDKLFEDKE